MKRIVGGLIVIASAFISTVYAQTSTPTFPLVAWVSKSNVDAVTIENGNGAALVIHITVTGGENAAGITISNCGNTTSVKAGSTAVCNTSDAKKPVSFSSDNPNQTASGTYQIQSQ